MKAIVTATLGLRLREKPWGNIITVMPHGAEVEILEEKLLWWKVRYNKTDGWAYSKYLHKTDKSRYELGIDFSSFNSVNAWKMPLPRVSIIRMSYGFGSIDPKFGERISILRHRYFMDTNRRDDKFRIGYYYVFQPWNPADKQYNYVTSIFRPLGSKREFLAIDVEYVRNWPTFDKRKAAEELRKLLKNLKRYVGKDSKVILYTSKYMWEKVIGDNLTEQQVREFSSTPLWVANYSQTAQDPVLPPLWDDWAIWQYSDRGRWPYIKGYVDLNRIKKTFLEEEDEVSNG